MNDMNGYDNRDRNERYYDDREDMYYRDEDYRDYRNYRDNYRRRDYDRRGGRINNRDYRNYRNYRNYREDYYEDLEMTIEDMKDTSRKLEDIAEMASNMNEKTMINKVAQKEKEHSTMLKQMLDKTM